MVNVVFLSSFPICDEICVAHLVTAFIVSPAEAWSTSSYLFCCDDRFIIAKLGFLVVVGQGFCFYGMQWLVLQ